ncbi:YkgJ family cysteine cluster protein [Leptothrix ochracea]|uniref:YkgJ family cysteine cluster protein n=1 Tax=Leptothrix ochracea TaxID=735331 RepID=UPI0034E27C11
MAPPERASQLAPQLDCQHCGACCSAFRVSFYWAEADVFGLPEEMIERVTPLYSCMAGTNASAPRCVALTGTLGEGVSCSIYAQRPSPCREVQTGDAQCLRARSLKGLDVLTPLPAPRDAAARS